MSFLATNGGVSGEDVRDLMLAAVEHRFGPANRLPVTIAWLNGSCYLAGKTRSFARDIDLELENHADRKSTEQWNGRSLRPHDQA
jgi:putative transposase